MQPTTRARFSVPLKGITLVCLPLVFELIFVFTLSTLVRQAEDDAARALRSAHLIEIGHRLIELSFSAASGCEGYIFTHHPLYKDVYQQSTKAFELAMNELRSTKPSRPDQEQAQQEVLVWSDKYLHMVEDDMKLGDLPPREAQRGIRDSLSGEVLRMLQNRVEDFLGEEEDVRRQQYLAQASSRRQLNQFVFFAVGCNVLLAVAMAVFFTLSISRRLRVMIDNTERLKKGRELHATVGGSDEIAQLDAVFHDMADSLKQAEQLKRDFVAMVSHDLRVPLGAVRLYLEALREGVYGQLSERGFKRAYEAERNTERLLQLIKDLLDIERLESASLVLSLEPAELNALVANAVANVQPLADEKSIEIDSRLANPTWIMAESGRIVQVLTNLLSNAVKYSPAAGRITVTLGADADSNSVITTVSDQGRGIPDDMHEEIFKRFRQVDAAITTEYAGSGLGLAICKQLVERHGGTIGVASVPGKGSSFWFKLPTCAPPPNAVPAAEKEKQEAGL